MLDTYIAGFDPPVRAKLSGRRRLISPQVAAGGDGRRRDEIPACKLNGMLVLFCRF